ncbi:MAG TPA: DUF2066 domain-containing protein [Steroidobacteraceae bacterium]
MVDNRSNPIARHLRFPAALLALAWLACCVLPPCAWAGRPVRVYEVDIRGGQSPAALQDAMREALVRATGRHDAATDPAFAALIADAPKYVKAYTPGARGQSQVVFDGVAVERAIAAAGRGVWDRDRPFTLVILYPPLPRATEDSARNELEQAAMARGLPISLVPLSPLDSAGNDLGSDALMQMAQKFGGDAVLVGRNDTGAAPGQWQWTLHTSFTSQGWSGPLAAGVDGAVDILAPAQGTSLAQTEVRTQVEIQGVSSLTDYAVVQRMLESVPGVRRAAVGEAHGASITFDVLVRGGADAVSRALGSSNHFARADTSNAQLIFQYRP